MKSFLSRQTCFAVAILFLAANFQLRAQTNSSDITPQNVLNTMQHVADWQLAHLGDNKRAPTDWVAGAGDAGLMALVGISGDAKYRDAALAIAETNNWQLGSRKFMADDQCVGQLYAELYLLYRDPKMIAAMREHFDAILATPPTNSNFDYAQPGHGQENWNWCDSLFMAPPTWLRLYAATGDERYLNFAVTNWWRTTDYLYDKDEHLFFRDSTYFKKTEANGKKVFWSRGNGWVMGGLVRMLQFLPMNHPDRPRFEQLFKDMAEKILSCQQPDGLWRASLLDPDSFPIKETSGSGFFTYALAWGVNQGLLDRATFEPAVRKGWAALTGCVDADGKLAHVQPIGADPKNFDADSTEPYGVGAFLLAGSEVYRMAVFENAKPMVDHPSIPSPPPGQTNEDFTVTWERVIKVQVTNPSSFRRDCETVEVNRYDKENSNLFGGVRFWPNAFPGSSTNAEIAILDGLSSRILDSQEYEFENDVPNHDKVKLLFQVDLAPGETRTFYILDSSALAAVPPPIVKTFARYVPERHDDFAWESDRIAHRMYGPALETWQAEPLTSSGIDVWVKRTRNLVINDMYGTMKLFVTNGPSQDDFKVGKTRGDGGLGIWKDGKNYVSKNWRTWKVITTGPIRSEFELTYDAWDAGGQKISETKRISIDAGSNLSRVESTFSSDDKSPIQVGVGLAERPGENTIVNVDDVPNSNFQPASIWEMIAHWQSSIEKGLFVQNQKESWMTYWQPQDFAKGVIGTAIVLPKGSIQFFTNDNPNVPDSKFVAPTKTLTEGQPALRSILAIAPAEIGTPFVYYTGAGWSESGDFPDAKSWNDYVSRFAERRDQPLQVTIGN
ncbi:MAG TPA: glycoside hydrolase family 88 protein [Verrucomicrobiae bacterium]|nr:glycoside hydrolase family 88 protein [Verrucomicrobiae bacterium]